MHDERRETARARDAFDGFSPNGQHGDNAFSENAISLPAGCIPVSLYTCGTSRYSSADDETSVSIQNGAARDFHCREDRQEAASVAATCVK